MKQYLWLLAGVVIGGIGAVMFARSLPPEEGTPEAKVMQLEKELRQTKNLVLQYESGRRKPGNRGRSRDGIRMIAEDLKAGREVSMDDVFATMKPWMRDLSPLFDRIRVRDEQKRFDELSGEFSRKYGLSAAHIKELRKMFEQRAKENRDRYNAVVNSDRSGLVDMIRASRNMENDLEAQREVDAFMEARLTGDQLDAYREDRLDEKYEHVIAESNRKYHRLNEMVELDEEQRQKAFGLLVRSSANYNEQMEYDGASGDRAVLSQEERNQQLLSIMNESQRKQYQEAVEQRKQEAFKDLQQIGIAPPRGWELLDGDDL